MQWQEDAQSIFLILDTFVCIFFRELRLPRQARSTAESGDLPSRAVVMQTPQAAHTICLGSRPGVARRLLFYSVLDLPFASSKAIYR